MAARRDIALFERLDNAGVHPLSKRTVLCVGYSIPGGDAEYVALDSERSLLDADIVVFEPQISQSYYEYGQKDYNGKPTLGTTGSFKAVEQSRHWKGELKAAAEHGKTVVVFLAKPEDAWVYTGERQTSGSGRNQKVTNIVAPFSSYASLPLNLGPVVPKSGREMVLTTNSSAIAAYWREFGQISPYEAYLDSSIEGAVLQTKTGSRTLGLLYKLGKGHVLLLPPPRYDEAAFTRTEKDGTEYWNDEGDAFGARLLGAILRIDAELRGEGGRTPPPEWSSHDSYRFSGEDEIEAQLVELAARIEGLRSERDLLSARLDHEGSARRLLFATGSELEEAILGALRELGYRAENFTDGESEFDAVFVSPEGERFLGEAEGKDNKAVNIDKLSQLERNIQEDFAREEVAEPARGVLFGNAQRLLAPQEREAPFTQKCLAGAKRSGISLVHTPDLFEAVRRLRTGGGEPFARACREAISAARGTLVEFPK